MGKIVLKVRSGSRDVERFPKSESDLGQSLFEMLRDSLGSGVPSPAMLTVDSDSVRQFNLGPLATLKRSNRERVLSAIAGQSGIEHAVLVGVWRKSGTSSMAAVFVESSNNSWWVAWQSLDENGLLIGDEPVTRSAIDGWPKPRGFGGWFARARRLGLHLEIEKPLVH